MKFYRDVLDGPLYYIIALLAVILIMAIIGFLMERKKLFKEKENKIAHVDQDVAPIKEVEIEKNNDDAVLVQPPVDTAPKPKEVINFTPEVTEEVNGVDENALESVSTEIPVFEEVGNNEIKVEDNN